MRKPVRGRMMADPRRSSVAKAFKYFALLLSIARRAQVLPVPGQP
ncbi:hypothetical protein ALO97_101274 [Pseudomonas syringae pv. tagetis]|uniref:Uncharacterized protein n=1 Tax=Pseudomonas syringae pv. tagetis TaxID=129140 RepID=A0A0Q0E8G3_9PSED|nr:hypothetical protein ALO44_101370 [Pseudomonas syringae pv. tagetis]RMW13427.1 hypothetical protein ALO98_101132 [Pseudomonas syringae pv. tagetis]RMW19134.1 hypothetical protein ALO97_101274 [Pseudomonas syringae pv. tagetis]